MNKYITKFTYPGYRITEHCNTHCPGCFSRELVLAPDPTIKQLEIVFKNLWRSGITSLGLMGGEPTVRYDLEEIVVLAKSIGFETILSTNGLLLSNKRLDLMNTYLDFLSLSLDASNMNDNDTYRGKGQWEAAMRIINHHDFHKHHFQLKINTIVHQKNIHDITNIPKLFADKPIRWKLLQFTPRLAGRIVKNEFAIPITKFLATGEEVHKKYPNLRISLRTYEIDEPPDVLIIRPNGDLLYNVGEEYRCAGNAYKDEVSDVIHKIQQIHPMYLLENHEEFVNSYR